MGKAGLPKFFWGYALEIVVYILKRVSSKSVKVTPYKIWTNKKSYLSHMKLWGSPAYVNQTMSGKLEAKSDMCLFVGYPKETNGYQFFNSLEQKVFVSKHVMFMEKEFLLEDGRSNVELVEVQNAQTYVDHLTGLEFVIYSDEETVDPSKAQALCGTSRNHIVLKRYGFLINEHKDVLLIEDDETTTYKKSLNSSESNKWLIIMKSKMDSMYTNQVLTLVDLPKFIKPIGCKWIFKKNMDMEGM